MSLSQIRALGVCFFWLVSTAVLYAQTGMNLAAGRVASQSSQSQWSNANDAQGAINGVKNGGFGFHTNEEINPWWQVDLGADYKLENVVLYNREDCCSERARTVQVLLSSDGVNFQKIYAHNGSIFGGVNSKRPLNVSINGVLARYVRLQLAERNAFHLDEVEVYGKSAQSQAQWVPYSGTIPANAVVGGSENGQPLYVGRMSFQGGHHPGKILPGGICNIGWGGKEYSFDQGFEILTAAPNTVTWVEYNGSVPANAIFGGYNDPGNSQPLYIAKHAYNGGEHCGKLWDNACNIGWGGREIVLNERIYILTGVLSSNSGITFYEHGGFQGASKTVTSDWDYSSNVEWNDRISSIRIPAGYKIQVFEHNFSGASKVLTSDWTAAENSPQAFNDIISSIRILEHPGAAAPSKAVTQPAVIGTPKATGATVRTTQVSYFVGQSIVVEYGGFPGSSSAWITIVPKGKSDSEWGDYQYAREKSGKLEYDLPFMNSGEYEVRGYFDTFDTKIQARHSFTIESGGQ